MTNPNLQFKEIHTHKKRAKLQDMMQEIARETLKKFPRQERLTQCPCCEGRQITFYVQKFGYDLDTCVDCGHIFTNPMPSLEALDCYYNSSFKEFENEFFLDSFDARIPIFTQRLDLLRKVGAGEHILDIGTAVGILLEANKNYVNKFKIDACDLNESSCLMLREKYSDVKVINENVLNLPNGNYDAVTLWDTIEHIPDVSKLLKAISRQLKSNGLFVFSTPNTTSLEWTVMAQDHVQLLPPGHVNLYNTKNIKKLLKRHDFETLSISTLNPSLDLSYLKDKFHSSSNSDCRKERFIAEIYKLFDDEEVAELIYSKIRENKFAGNMVVVAKKIS